MSELMNARSNRPDFRWHLLTTVSALALLAAVYGASAAKAEDQDIDRPTVWIELGGQLERVTSPQEAFSPPFMASITQANLLSALNVQQSPAYATGGEGKASFQSDGSDWVFAVSVEYGRSNANRHLHQQTPNAGVPAHFAAGSKYVNLGTKYPNDHVKFADATAKLSESHTVLDFQAGKDVGLGMFGNRGTSVLSAGLRFAQFSSKANIGLRDEPDVQYPSAPINSPTAFLAFENASVHFHDYAGMANIQRNFRGLGPSAAWNASAPFAGDTEHGEITLDWGANAAVLFGRQKASGHHQTNIVTYNETGFFLGRNNAGGATGHGLKTGDFGCIPSQCGTQAHLHHTKTANFNRMRSVVVPIWVGSRGLRSVSRISRSPSAIALISSSA